MTKEHAPDLTPSQFSEKIAVLEESIGKHLAMALNQFRKDTGRSVNYLSVDFVRVTSFGEEFEHYVLGAVSVDVDLEPIKRKAFKAGV